MKNKEKKTSSFCLGKVVIGIQIWISELKIPTEATVFTFAQMH